MKQAIIVGAVTAFRDRGRPERGEGAGDPGPGRMVTFSHLMEAAAYWKERQPDKTFMICGERRMTYGEFHRQAEALAGMLHRLGVRKGDRVLVGFPNSIEVVVSYMAINRAGAIAVAVNPSFTEREAGYLAGDSGARVAVIDENLQPLFLQLRKKVPTLETLLVHGRPESGALSFDEAVTGEQGAPELEADSDDASVMLYTSGTTGVPKGAVLSHRALLFSHYALADVMSTTDRDRMLMPLPAYHLFFVLLGYVHMLCAGGTLVIQGHIHPRSMLEAVERYRITQTAGVPSLYVLMVQESERRPYRLDSLRIGITGGAPVPTEYLERFEAMTGSTLLEVYGMTEYGVATIERPDGERRPGTAGKPVPGVRLRIVDEQDRDVPVGEVGEIVLQHPGIMDGYWNLPEVTAHAFRNGWFHTGDLARMDADGYVKVVDRLSDLIIYGGYNIYPKEIENVIYMLPEVAEAAVVGIKDPVKGEEPRAFIVLKEGARLDAQAVLDHCRKNLAPYKIPRQVVFVDLLPKTATGKIRKVEIASSYAV